MADLAISLLRTVARAFYSTEHVLVIDALALHSTLQDSDLAYLMGTNVKSIRKPCGKLKEHGLLSVQTRTERRTDGTQSYYGGSNGQPGKERVTHKDWYYLNFHRAIDSIKYRMYKLNKLVESRGAPTTEKKELDCPVCKAQWMYLELDFTKVKASGSFECPRCNTGALKAIPEEERASENESMKRLNSQLEKILRLMQQIDASTVPENDFQEALSKHKPVIRDDANPGQQRTEIVDLPGKGMQSTKGLDIKPEKISVQVQDDETVKKENAAAEAQARKEKEARQNALPDWISKSTVSGDVTAAGAKEQRLKEEREGHLDVVKEDERDEKKPDGGDNDFMESYYKELAADQAKEAARAQAEQEDEDDDDDDEDEDDFEDVNVSNSTPQSNGKVGAPENGQQAESSTKRPADSGEESNGEPNAKRAKIDGPSPPKGEEATPVAEAAPVMEDTPVASDEDEDDLEFENV